MKGETNQKRRGKKIVIKEKEKTRHRKKERRREEIVVSDNQSKDRKEARGSGEREERFKVSATLKSNGERGCDPFIQKLWSLSAIIISTATIGDGQ